MLVEVELMTVARMQLERLLPRLVEDAREAVHLLRRTERHQDEAIREGLGNSRMLDRGAATRQYRLDDLVASVSELRSGEQLEALLRRIVAAGRELVGARYAALGVLGPSGELDDFLHAGIDPATASEIGALPRGHGLLGVLRGSPGTQRIHDIATAAASCGFPAGHPPMQSFLGVPITVGGEVFGSLYLCDRTDGFPFDDDDEHVTEILASVAGAAIGNARLFGQLEGHRRELAALHSLSSTMLSSESIDEVLKDLTRLVRDLLDADLAVAVGASSGDDLQVLSADGLGADQVHGVSIPSAVSAISPSQPPPGSVHVGDVSDLHPDHPLSRAKLFGPVLSVALHSSGRFLGKLTVARRAGARPFDADDTARAHSFAQQAGIAFRQRAERVHSERVAHQLRQALQPPALPTVPGAEVAALYLPGDGDLSGDFYDVWPLTGDAWGLACGDVAGHGVEAATLTSLARHTLHTAALTTDHPIEVLHLLNTTFRTATERFCTCIFAHVRPTLSTMEVTLARGGHPHPIVVRADGTVQPVEVSGTLLGVFTRPNLELATITLEAGDSLVLYTDGLIEARNHTGEQFGEHRVTEVLGAFPRRSATELVDDLHRAVRAHAATLNDDLTIVAITGTGS